MLTSPRTERLRRADQFQAVFLHGKRIDRPCCVSLWLRTSDQELKVGFAVSRQVGGAVPRNRVKRRLRAAYERRRVELPEGVRMVFVGRPAALEAPFKDLLADMERAIITVVAACAHPAALRRGVAGGAS